MSRCRQQEAERLYEFSQQMLVTGNVIDLLNLLPQMIAATFNLAGRGGLSAREGSRVPVKSGIYGCDDGGASRCGLHARSSLG